jgi:hypothetical protein
MKKAVLLIAALFAAMSVHASGTAAAGYALAPVTGGRGVISLSYYDYDDYHSVSETLEMTSTAFEAAVVSPVGLMVAYEQHMAFEVGSFLFCPTAWGAGVAADFSDSVTLQCAFMVMPAAFYVLDGDVAMGPKGGLTFWMNGVGLSLSVSYYSFIFNDADVFSARAGLSVRTGKARNRNAAD